MHRWRPWQAWAFAIGLDAAIVVSELLQIFCANSISPIAWLPTVVIVSAVFYSAFLNSYVNLLDIGWSKVGGSRSTPS